MSFSLSLHHRHIDMKKSYQLLEKDGLKNNTGSDYSSTRTGLKYQIYNGRVPPQQVGPEKDEDAIEIVQHIL